MVQQLLPHEILSLIPFVLSRSLQMWMGQEVGGGAGTGSIIAPKYLLKSCSVYHHSNTHLHVAPKGLGL